MHTVQSQTPYFTLLRFHKLYDVAVSVYTRQSLSLKWWLKDAMCNSNARFRHNPSLLFLATNTLLRRAAKLGVHLKILVGAFRECTGRDPQPRRPTQPAPITFVYGNDTKASLG